MITTAIVGLGKIAQTKYLPALLECENASIVSLYDKSMSLTAGICRSCGLDPSVCAKSLEQVIQARPDVVFLLNHDHYEVAKTLLNEGISICVEKPLCWSSVQAEELCALAKSRGARLYAAYMKQFDAAFQEFRRLVQLYGPPLMLNISCYAGNNKRWCDPQYRIIKEQPDEKVDAKKRLKDAWSSFYQAQGRPFFQQSGLSQTLLQLGIHQINLLHEILGPVWVCSAHNTVDQGIQTFCAILRQNTTTVNYRLLPLFSGPWLWKESYEAVYPDRILIYEPGSPFLHTSESVLRTIGGDSMTESSCRFETEDPFRKMIRVIAESHGTDPTLLNPESAVRDIQTIEQLLLASEKR